MDSEYTWLIFSNSCRVPAARASRFDARNSTDLHLRLQISRVVSLVIRIAHRKLLRSLSFFSRSKSDNTGVRRERGSK